MKRVYCLYRVSTIGQVDKNDIPMQRQACHTFAKEKGWQIIEEFSEKGVSGYKKSADQREALQELKQAALQKRFDVLLVFMFDRLGRRDDETPFVVEWFVKNGIEVWSVAEGEQRFEDHIDKLLNYIRFWQSSNIGYTKHRDALISSVTKDLSSLPFHQQQEIAHAMISRIELGREGAIKIEWTFGGIAHSSADAGG